MIKTSLVDNKKNIDLSTLTFQKFSDKDFFPGEKLQIFLGGIGANIWPLIIVLAN